MVTLDAVWKPSVKFTPLIALMSYTPAIRSCAHVPALASK
jgi:hypothetical protein